MCVRVIRTLLAGIVLLSLCPSVCAEPSKELEGALGVRLPAIETDVRNAELGQVIDRVRWDVRRITKAKTLPQVGIEYEGKTSKPRVKVRIPEGTLNQQLDAITKAADYVWQANGDWINLIPKSKVDDPNYVMNLRIPGKVMFSRGVGENTSIKEWMKEHGISVAKMLMNLQRIVPKSQEGLYDLPPLPECIELNNPTVREHCNAHHAFYGEEIWTVWPEQSRDSMGKTRTSLLFWSSSSRPKFEDIDRPAQPKK